MRAMLARHLPSTGAPDGQNPCGSRWLRRCIALAVMTVAVIGVPNANAQQSQALTGLRTITLDGRAVRVQALGLEGRRPGTPVIVFEAGGSNSLEVWGSVVSQVSAIAPVVAYDRAGLGRSEWDEVTPTPRHVADRLIRSCRQLAPRLRTSWSDSRGAGCSLATSPVITPPTWLDWF
jgi:hypothetical protein